MLLEIDHPCVEQGEGGEKESEGRRRNEKGEEGGREERGRNTREVIIRKKRIMYVYIHVEVESNCYMYLFF